MVWVGMTFQAEKSMCKGPVAGVCEEQEEQPMQLKGEGAGCERQTGRLMDGPGVVS